MLYDNICNYKLQLKYSSRTVSRRWKDMNLTGNEPRGSVGDLTRGEVVQLIGDAMGQDPAKNVGTGGLCRYISETKGIKLPL